MKLLLPKLSADKIYIVTHLRFAVVVMIIGGLAAIHYGHQLSKSKRYSEKYMSVQKEFQTKTNQSKPIILTDDVKHNVPLNEIVGGGPPPDGIPPIDQPRFIPVDRASFLSDNDPGIALEFDGVNRFYPFQILVWHEIVNDIINGKRVLITYCPLCSTGIIYDPMVQGERVAFGTSGKLWNSNLVMYDRKTGSLWSQILGKAIAGEMTNATLVVLPSDLVRFGAWRAVHPNGEVLSRETGAVRFYGNDPYGDYYTSPAIYFPVNHKDQRLHEKNFILGIVVNGRAKAYATESIKKQPLEDIFENKTIVGHYDERHDIVYLYEKKQDGSLERINPVGAFWFSWVAAHPDTQLYK